MQTVWQGNFCKTVAIGGTLISLDSASMARPMDSRLHDLRAIGECKRVTITCISEVGWWDTHVLLADLMKAGGPREADQWTSDWSPSNAAGSCSLVEVESLTGAKTKFLVDTGWNVNYMDERLKAEGVDRMLKNGEIAFLYITHEHLDHFWGLEAVLRYNPEIKIIIPSSFQPPAMSYLGGADFAAAGPKNAIRHKGEIIKFQVGEITELMEGAVSVGFDVPIILKIRGEQSLYFNVKDAGLVLVTGCCHQNIVTFADYALNNLNAGGKLYGLYGGLHIAPFGTLEEEERGWIEKMGAYGFEKIAANHCTGLLAVQRMAELGYPLVKGTGSRGSQSDLYVGNGDSVVFG
ncbi:MAG: MBL fold metallo-hydrolase [Desulfomonile tiedjei]|nr:MBL fold metallo-hydrolase [Desulfomonile tiedjei]